jgi:hypothetical protein
LSAIVYTDKRRTRGWHGEPEGLIANQDGRRDVPRFAAAFLVLLAVAAVISAVAFVVLPNGAV